MLSAIKARPHARNATVARALAKGSDLRLNKTLVGKCTDPLCVSLSAKHRIDGKVGNGAVRLAQDTLGGRSAKSVEESIRTIGCHHDQI